MEQAGSVLLAAVLFAGAPVSAYPQAPAPALEELIRQAEAGDVQAQFRLGSAYDAGTGVARNVDEAERWYRRAGESGHAQAQNSVGGLLQARGRFAEALPWYEKASSQGLAVATNNLGYLYDLGRGVPQDRRKAFELYSRAAEMGWADAMWNIANLHGAGQLGPADLVAACTWTLRAQRFADPSNQQLHAHVRQVMPELQRKLTSEQFAECKQAGESWMPKEQTAATVPAGTVVSRPETSGRLLIGSLARLPRPLGFVVADLRAPDMKAGSQLKQTYKAPFSPFRQPVPLAKYERTLGDGELSAPPVELLAEKLIERYGDKLADKRLVVHEFTYKLEQVVNKPQGMNYTVTPGGGTSLATALALSAIGSAVGTAMMQGKGIDLRLTVKIDAELDGRRIVAIEHPMSLHAGEAPARITRFAIERYLRLLEEPAEGAPAASPPKE